MSYVDRILHLQRTIEIIWKQIYLLSAYHVPPLTFLNILSPKLDHYRGDGCPPSLRGWTASCLPAAIK